MGNADLYFWVVASLLGLILCMAMMGVSLWSESPGPVVILESDDYISSQIKTYKFAKLTGDDGVLNSNDLAAIHYLQKAAKVVDDLFWRQYLLNNKEVYNQLVETQKKYEEEGNDAKANQYANLVEYYTINTGPYEVLVDYNPFIGPTNEVIFPSERKPGAEYYPEDMTTDEWNVYLQEIESKDENEYKCATSSVSVIKRSADSISSVGLKCYWYSEEYAEYLEQIHDYLLLASKYTEDETMKDFLEARAKSCLENDYISSDEYWVNVNQTTTFDITIGPYETYMDGVNGIKASFEAYIGITKQEDTKRISTYSSYLNELQGHLPMNEIMDEGETPELSSQVKIIDLIYSSGEAKQASQTLAYNLPNIPTANNQSRQIMLYNVQEAKFNNILTPIAAIINNTNEEEVKKIISFETNFQHTISHEFSHALGPSATKDGQAINAALGSYYSAFEEAKADVGAMWSVTYLAKNQRPCEDGNTDACGYAIQCKNANFQDNEDMINCDEYLEQFFTTFLGDIIRTLRFGVSEAHGQAVASYLNTFIDAGCISVEGTTMSVDTEAMKEKSGELFGKLLDTEYNGDMEGAKGWLENQGIIRQEIQVILDKVNGSDIPVDIRPVYKDYQLPSDVYDM